MAVFENTIKLKLMSLMNDGEHLTPESYNSSIILEFSHNSDPRYRINQTFALLKLTKNRNP